MKFRPPIGNSAAHLWHLIVRISRNARGISRARIWRAIEIATLIAGVWLAATSWAALNDIEGAAPVVEARTKAFLKASDYPTPLPAQFALRHDCHEIMRGTLFMRIGTVDNIPKFHSNLWQTLSRGAIGWPQLRRGPLDVYLELLPFDNKPYPCQHVAIHVPGITTEMSYTVHRTDVMNEELLFKPIGSSPTWAHGANIVISTESTPGFEGKVSFTWEDGLQVLGEGTIGLVLPIGFWQDLDPQVRASQATFIVQLQSPPGFRLAFVNYPLDKEATHHPQGDINTFRVGPAFGGPLIAVFREQIQEASKSNRLVFWSTLFGAAVVLVLQSFLSIARWLLTAE